MRSSGRSSTTTATIDGGCGGKLHAVVRVSGRAYSTTGWRASADAATTTAAVAAASFLLRLLATVDVSRDFTATPDVALPLLLEDVEGRQNPTWVPGFRWRPFNSALGAVRALEPYTSGTPQRETYVEALEASHSGRLGLKWSGRKRSRSPSGSRHCSDVGLLIFHVSSVKIYQIYKYIQIYANIQYTKIYKIIQNNGKE